MQKAVRIVKDAQGNIYKVFWNEKYCMYSRICVKSSIQIFKDAKWDLWSLAKNNDMEVIGNIFDDADLLVG